MEWWGRYPEEVEATLPFSDFDYKIWGASRSVQEVQKYNMHDCVLQVIV